MKTFKRAILTMLSFCVMGYGALAQDWDQKFEQLGTMLPTGNSYRTSSGAPGINYWQQKADYLINVEIDDTNQKLTGSETITYTNQSPDVLTYLWVQLDQNVRARDSNTPLVSTSRMGETMAAKSIQRTAGAFDYEGGFKIASVKDSNGNDLENTINKTMMRIDLPTPMKTGDKFTFSIDWSYNIYDRMEIGGRGGYEYFPEEDNYAYAIAQWYPRMAVYSDFEGWQNKQFMGRGEFALAFGDFEVNITVPSDHIVGATGFLQNPKDVLTSKELSRFNEAQKTYDAPVIIVTQEEAEKKEKVKSKEKSTWTYKAENVRDFAFTSSRKYIWDAMAVKIGDKSPLAMSYYPKEGNPLWERESTIAVKNTLEVYSKYTIDYPYPVAISVHAANQGMEYPMICYNYGRPNPDGTYSDRTLQGMVGVIVHEVGHNYFPMIINSDERQWTWMDEGLNSFLDRQTFVERYPDFSVVNGSPKGITRYMKGDKSYIRPIMTNSENIIQFGSNAYSKPSAAMVLLRETVMGPELFDKAFKTYAERWAFKHPTPADFFRTMEDASAVDLDWFWRGWFYSTDHVDVTVDNVKWFKVQDSEQALEGRNQSGKIKNPANLDSNGNFTDFSNGFEMITITDTDSRYYGEYRNQIDDDEVRAKLAGKNVYEITMSNTGGLVTPVIIEWTYKDGQKEIEKIPAEIWRQNEKQFTKVFFKDKEVINVAIDPLEETGDTNLEDNHFPKVEYKSRFERFGETSAKENAKLIGDWTGILTDPNGEERPIIFHFRQGENGKLEGSLDSPNRGLFDFELGNIYTGKGNVEAGLGQINGKYVGTMSADGTTITGTLHQNDDKLPLKLRKQ